MSANLSPEGLRAARAMREVLRSIVDTVKVAGDLGAPSSPLYLALQQGMGVTLEQYQQIMSTLVRNGFLEERGHCFYWKRDL